MISPQEAQTNPRAEAALQMVRGIVGPARQIAVKFPQVSSEVRQIMDLVSKIQQKISQAGPNAEPMAPPV